MRALTAKEVQSMFDATDRSEWDRQERELRIERQNYTLSTEDRKRVALLLGKDPESK